MPIESVSRRRGGEPRRTPQHAYRVARVLQRRLEVHPDIPFPRAVAQRGIIPEQPSRGPPRLLRRHPGPLEVRGAHLDVKLQLFVDLPIERAPPKGVRQPPHPGHAWSPLREPEHARHPLGDAFPVAFFFGELLGGLWPSSCGTSRGGCSRTRPTQLSADPWSRGDGVLDTANPPRCAGAGWRLHGSAPGFRTHAADRRRASAARAESSAPYGRDGEALLIP